MREANIGREVTEQIHVLFGSSLIGEVLQSVFVGEFEQQFIELLYFEKIIWHLLDYFLIYFSRF